MPQVIDYDSCYFALWLKPGASLEEIERQWKFIVTSMHPDRFKPGPLQEEATRKLQEANNAHDLLKTYWEKNGQAPPSNGVGKGGTPPPPPKKSAGAPPPPVSPAGSAPSTVPFGPPPFKKNAIHEFYDYVDRCHSKNDSTGLIAMLCAWVFATVAPVAAITYGISELTGISVSALTTSSDYSTIFALLIVASGIASFAWWSADYDVYRIEENPFVGLVPGSSQEALERIEKAICRISVPNAKWQVDKRASSLEIKLIPSQEKPQDHPYIMVVKAQAMDRDGENGALVCYWFEAPAMLLKMRIAGAMKTANQAIRSAWNS